MRPAGKDTKDVPLPAGLHRVRAMARAALLMRPRGMFARARPLAVRV